MSPGIIYWDAIHFRINGDAGRLLENIVRTLLKVTCAIKHKNTGEEIIIYAHRVCSLLLKLEENKVKYSYFHFTMLLAFERQLCF